MKCETVQKQLEAYIEGELSESRKKAVEAHISACESCRKELALAQSIPRLVGSLMTPPTPEEIIPDTLEQLHETSNGRWGWLESLLSGRWQYAAAACLLVAVVLLGIGHQRMNREPQITEA